MIKFFTILLLASSLSLAYNKKDLLIDYKNKNYKRVCTFGVNINSKDEDILSIVGDACLRIDYINPLGDVIKRLVSTAKYRENASYFTTILLQKKLIYQFMNDDINIDNIRLPKTSNILSIVFENLVKKNYKILDKKSKKIMIILKNKKYIIWKTSGKQVKIIIDEYENSEFIKRHWYL